MFSYFVRLFWQIRGLRVYALVGRTGTGKSFRAKLIAQKYGIELVIDDGLLIQGNRVVAGKSAKKEKYYLAAVKAAIFSDKTHRDEVARALHKSHFRKILVLGTSVKMVSKICETLAIPLPGKIINIEEVATAQEIEKAIQSRQIEGKHVIPVPALEIRKTYPSIFYDSIRVFFKRSFGASIGSNPRSIEKSVVRPEYSKRGRISISEMALSQMVMQCLHEFDETIKARRMTIRADTQGYRIILMLDVPFDNKLLSNAHEIQQYIIDSIEKYTGILIEEVSIVIDRFRIKK